MRVSRPSSSRRVRNRLSVMTAVTWALITFVGLVTLFWPSVRVVALHQTKTVWSFLLAQIPESVLSTVPGWVITPEPQPLVAEYFDLLVLDHLLPLDVNRWLPSDLSSAGALSSSGTLVGSPQAGQQPAEAEQSLASGHVVSRHRVPGSSQTAARIVRWTLLADPQHRGASMGGPSAQSPGAAQPPPDHQRGQPTQTRAELERLEVAAAAVVEPGQSVKWMPLPDIQPSTSRTKNKVTDSRSAVRPQVSDPVSLQEAEPAWENGSLSLVVYCLGATADRLDAPGKLEIIADSPLMPTVTTFSVSHLPQVVRLPLGHLLAQKPHSLTIHWSRESSGTLVVLGVQQGETPGDRKAVGSTGSSAVQQTPLPVPSGKVLVTTDSLHQAEPVLQDWQSTFATRKASSGLRLEVGRIGTIWPAHTDPADNQRAFLRAWEGPAGESGFVKTAGAEHRLDVYTSESFDELQNGSQHKEPAWIQPRVRSRSVLGTERLLSLRSRQQNGVLESIGRIVSRGVTVHAHLWQGSYANKVGEHQPAPENRPDATVTGGDTPVFGPSAPTVARLWGRVLDGETSLATLRGLSLLARDSDLVTLAHQEHAHTFERLSMDLWAAAVTSNAAMSALRERFLAAVSYAGRVVTERRDEVLGYDKELPREFAPGMAMLLWMGSAVDPQAVSGGSGSAAVPLSSGVAAPNLVPRDVPWSQTDFLDGLGQLYFSEGRVWPTQEAEASDPDASHSQRAASWMLQSNGPDEGLLAPQQSADGKLHLVAEVQGTTGHLHVFNRGWIFLPHTNAYPEIIRGASVPADSPIFGLALRDVPAARKLLFERALAGKHFAVNILVPEKALSLGASVEIRSEFPMWRCLSTVPQTQFVTGFGYDGAMTVTATFGPSPDTGGSPSRGHGALVRCLVDSSRPNPVPKRKPPAPPPGSEPARSELAKKARTLPVTLMLRMMAGGARVPLTHIYVGPYSQVAQSFVQSETALQRAQLAFDLKGDAPHLLSLWQSVEGGASSDFFAVWLGAAVGAVDTWAENAPLATEWERDVSDFLERRASVAEKERKQAL